jgi:hypothetical protein
VTGPHTLKILARHKEDFLVRIERIPDGHLRASVAPATGQHDDIGAFEESECRVTEPWCLQTLPVQSGVLRPNSKITRELDQARDGEGFAVNDIAAIDPSGFIAPALPAQLEET